jgi:hypothetical protein
MEERKGHGRMAPAVTGELLYSFHQLSINEDETMGCYVCRE